MILIRSTRMILILLIFVISGQGFSEDWPTWRYDTGRTARTPKKLPEKLYLQWVRKYPPLKPAFWQERQERLQFDLGYEPIVAGNTMFLGSSINDSVIGIDTNTGSQIWQFFCDGPVRFAPVYWERKIYFASDDGCFYCLKADDGTLIWKHRAVPSERKILGNGRLISVWPIRGGPVIAVGKVYFAAGVLPFEGIFIYALDANNGDVVWLNDSCGSLLIKHPHNWNASFGGPSPQGYLFIKGNELIVPSSRSFPAYFDLQTGKLTKFAFGMAVHGSRPGGWFVVLDENGEVTVDPLRNPNEGQAVLGLVPDRLTEGEVLGKKILVDGTPYKLQQGISEEINAGGKEFKFSENIPEVEGKIHSIIAANGKLFVVTRQGSIYCFGANQLKPQIHELKIQPLNKLHEKWTARCKTITKDVKNSSGYAIVAGACPEGLLEELAIQTKLHIIAVKSNPENIDELRRNLDKTGLYGNRIVVHPGEPTTFGLPPYFARLIVSEKLDEANLDAIFCSLHPYGGAAWFLIPQEQHDVLARLVKKADYKSVTLQRLGEFSVLRRIGPLPGATDYNGYENYDELIKSPMGTLWFGDTAFHDKWISPKFGTEDYIAWGSPPSELDLPTVTGGIMKYRTTDPYTAAEVLEIHKYLAATRGKKKPAGIDPATKKEYREVFTDVYSGLVISHEEAKGEMTQKNPKKIIPKTKISINRINPLTGIEEGRNFIKNYGCDQMAVDYGYILTMRSGSSAYYDKRLESGTINFGAVRSGCRNSIVPANGVMLLPHWTGGCFCNYPLATSMALVHMPETYEQWTSWGGMAKGGAINRVGINFGAKGDRIVEDGTLWLEYPVVGGPSPDVPVSIQTAGNENLEFYYRHSVWVKGGVGWPWVIASGVKGLSNVKISLFAKKTEPYSNTFSVRWTGKILPPTTGKYTFYAKTSYGTRLWIDGKLIIDNDKNLRRGRKLEERASLTLQANKKYDLVMEYYPSVYYGKHDSHSAVLSWSVEGVPKAVIPAEILSTPDGKKNGVIASYFDGNSDFSGPSAVEVVPQINFNWGKELPVILQKPQKTLTPAGHFTVRLYFAEPEYFRAGKRVFSVTLQGQEVLKNLEILSQAGGPMRGLVKEFRGIKINKELIVGFIPKTGKPLICGVELIRE